MTGKRVGVIGAGSSAIQVIPTVQPSKWIFQYSASGDANLLALVVKSLTSFIRSPTWIAPQFLGQLAKDGRGTKYTEEQKAEFQESAEALLSYRREIDHLLNSRFPNFYKGSEQQRMAREMVEKGMREKLAGMDPKLRESLIPDFDVGCRR